MPVVMLTLSVLLLLSPGTSDGPWQWPLGDREVERSFEPPASAYGPGHRGIDLPGTPGAVVRAVAPGTVTFAGDVAGVPVVVVDHGAERSTYQPVEASVAVGDAVDARTPIGSLVGGHRGCAAAACLHLGRRVGEAYLDPLAKLTTAGRFRLVSPDGPPPAPPFGTGGELRRPVGGPVTSAYGMRVHPITGVRKLHDGIDFGAPCGTPVRAAASGRVTSARWHGAFGRRVEISHGAGSGTSYSHLSSISARAGSRVSVGEVIGRVGTTGSSTGCHLHFSVTRGGRTVNPAPLL